MKTKKIRKIKKHFILKAFLMVLFLVSFSLTVESGFISINNKVLAETYSECLTKCINGGENKESCDKKCAPLEVNTTTFNGVTITNSTTTSTTEGHEYYETHGALSSPSGEMRYAGSQNTVTPQPFKYSLLESFPGFYNAGQPMTDLPALILAIYKFGIWTVGIAAMFMITIGGIMYMTSAGNKSTASSAKDIIWDSIYGIIGALSAYLILYVINPDLVKISLDFTPVAVSEFGGPKGMGNPNPASGSCKTEEMLGKIKTLSQGKIDPCLTFALLNTESGCTPAAQSPAGACGIAQMMPGTANVSCSDLKKNVDLSISKGINYLLSNKSLARGNLSGSGNAFAQATMDLYAAYNGGPGVLAASKDCSGLNSYGYSFVKWDCTVNAGGYKETQAASPRFLNSYLVCNDDATLQKKLK